MKKEYRKDVNVLDELAEKWPSSVVARSEIGKFTGGLLHGRSMANRECRADATSIPRFRMGKKVFYRVDDVIDFLKAEISQS